MIFQTDKHERPTELGMAIDRLMTPACETAVAFELADGATCRVAMARVGRNNPFTVANIQAHFPDATGITQDDLDSLWMANAVDICLSAIL